ncbi:MAG: hypothetical protein KA330_10515 [Chitinophagaceae bacterium]|nr:hypothetical protein [Chitinophagaceae bacterium]
MENKKVFCMIGMLIMFISCQSNNPENSHKALIKWIDEGNFRISDTETITDDSYIINLLEQFTLLDTLSEDKDIYMKLSSDRVRLDSAKYYHKFYQNRRDSIALKFHPRTDTFLISKDTSNAVLIDLQKLWPAMQTYFTTQLSNPARYDEIGFLIYHSNYGQWGYKINSRDTFKFQSSTLIQLATRDPQDVNKWSVINGQIYNFGDLKPPKKMYLEEIK